MTLGKILHRHTKYCVIKYKYIIGSTTKTQSMGTGNCIYDPKHKSKEIYEFLIGSTPSKNR